jgi:hypothetical protein
MARHAPLRSVAATVLGTLLTATAASAAQQPAVGGTLELGQSGADESIVIARSRTPAVALLPGRRVIAAVGDPGARGAAGRVRVVRLKAGRIAAASRSAIAGPAKGARAGAALAAVPPLAGDRNDGLLVGAPRAPVARRGRPGVVILVPEPARTRRLRLGASNAITVLGAKDGDEAGASVATVPDIDGDKRPELVIGAPGTDPKGRRGAGAAYVVPSRRMRLGDIVDLADRAAALRIDGPLPGAGAGRAVAGMRDTDGDGRGEAIVGAPSLGAEGSGAAYVVHLAPGRPVDLAAPDAPALALEGSGDERAGTAVAGPGDLNDDGQDEVAIGAPRAGDELRGQAGAVYVVTPGAATGAVPVADAGTQIVGKTRGDRAGSAVAPAGRALGSDQPDLLVGTPGVDSLGRFSTGAAYVVSGAAATGPVDLALLGRSGVRLAGGSRGEVTGAALAGAVDVDRDGRADVLVGARADDADHPGTPSTVLQSIPRLTELPPSGRRARGCDARADARATSMVVDTSRVLVDADPFRLRAGALQFLVAHPSSQNRVIGAVEAAPRPAEVFPPLIPGDLRADDEAGVVDGLIDEAVQRPTGAGDLRAALVAAKDRNQSMQTAIVVAGADAVSTADPVPGLRANVIGVGIEPGSAQEGMLRGLAAASRGRYRGVSADELQAQVARFDARLRCETRVKADVDTYPVTASEQASRSGTVVPRGYEIEAEATIGENRHFADLVQSWNSSQERVKPYDLTVTEEGGANTETRFSSDDVKRALTGKEVQEKGITLIGGAGEGFITLRIGFDREDQWEKAMASRHHSRRVNFGGGHAARNAAVAARPLRVYTQFFQPPPDP